MPGFVGRPGLIRSPSQVSWCCHHRPSDRRDSSIRLLSIGMPNCSLRYSRGRASVQEPGPAPGPSCRSTLGNGLGAPRREGGCAAHARVVLPDNALIEAAAPGRNGRPGNVPFPADVAGRLPATMVERILGLSRRRAGMVRRGASHSSSSRSSEISSRSPIREAIGTCLHKRSTRAG